MPPGNSKRRANGGCGPPLLGAPGAPALEVGGPDDFVGGPPVALIAEAGLLLWTFFTVGKISLSRTISSGALGGIGGPPDAAADADAMGGGPVAA